MNIYTILKHYKGGSYGIIVPCNRSTKRYAMPAAVNIQGNVYGRLTVLQKAPNRGRRTMWLCRCECGKEVVVHTDRLRIGNTQSCGCLRITDMVGRRYGRWTVIAFAKIVREATWLCRCDCGTERVVRGGILRNGTSRSCGCINKEKLRAMRLLPEGIAARNQILGRTRRNAVERGYTCKLTDDEMLSIMMQPCHYCGGEPANFKTAGECNGSFVYNGIDRIDNSRSYTIDNVVPCCKHCNYAKRDRTVEEFLAWIERVYRHSSVEYH